jgi:hypothetical protein
MGTSTSSKGGSAGSPFDPEWLVGEDGGVGTESNSGGTADGDDDGNTADAPPEAGDSAEESTEAGENESGNVDAQAVAPDRRFAPARLKMSAYLAGGGRGALGAAAKSMVNKGMGGPRRAASTMRRTAKGAGQLGQFLAAARDGTDTRVTDWVERVRSVGLSANDLILEIVKQVLPDSGSVDDDSLQNAAAEALGKLYEADEGVDILSLTDQQIFDVIGYVVANDVCNRMDLQLGQTYERLKHAPQEIQMYRNDVKEWVHEKVRAVMDQYRGMRLDPHQLASKVLASAMKVFAE